MSSSRKPWFDRVRSHFTIKGQSHSICTSNSVVPLQPVANSQHEIINNGDGELSAVVISPIIASQSTSITLEVKPAPSLDVKPSPKTQHTAIQLPEDDGNSVRQRVLPGSSGESWKDPFIVSSHIVAAGSDGSSLAGESEDTKTNPSQYLQIYYDAMYYTGFCTYKARRDPGTVKTNWWVLVGYLQKATFWSLAILSAFQSICLSKFYLLEFMEKQEYFSGVSLGHHFACFLAKMYAINLFAFKKSKTDTMLHEMEKYEKCANVCTSTWKRKLVVVLLMSTLAFGIAQTIVDGEYEDDDGIIIASSKEFVVDLLVWKSKNFTNVSTALENKYGKLVTPATITFASVVITRDVSSYMVLGIMFDLVVLVASVVYAYVKTFIKDVKAVTANVPKENVDEWNQLQARREVVWKKYRNLRAVVSAVNAVFDPLLKLMHGGNLLMFAFFMALCVFSSLTWISILLVARDLVKVEIGYYIAGRIAEVNDIIRAWLRNWALYTGKIKVGNETFDIFVVLDELKADPIGLGKGNFLIHHTFHFKFLGLVGSVFFSMADEEKKL